MPNLLADQTSEVGHSSSPHAGLTVTYRSVAPGVSGRFVYDEKGCVLSALEDATNPFVPLPTPMGLRSASYATLDEGMVIVSQFFRSHPVRS